MSGKGDGLRPRAVSKAVADANWERTFGRKDEDLTALHEQIHRKLSAIYAQRSPPSGKLWGFGSIVPPNFMLDDLPNERSDSCGPNPEDSPSPEAPTP